MRTVATLAALLWERVPLGYDIQQSGGECRRLAREYAAVRRLGDDIKIDALDDLGRDVVAWVRARGYELLDEPPGPYPTRYEPADRGEWVPI